MSNNKTVKKKSFSEKFEEQIKKLDICTTGEFKILGKLGKRNSKGTKWHR